MKRLFCILALLLALCCMFVACDEPACQHRDANDDALCDTCGETYTDGTDVTPETPESPETPEQPEHTHAFGAWSVTTTATCQTKGAETRTCACGESETRDIAKNMDNHSAWGTWGVTTPATCGTTGVEARTCACGERETREIAATGAHDFTAKVQTSTYLKSAANCQGPAEYYYKCSLCDDHGTSTYKVGAKTTHVMDENNICTTCSNAYIYFGEYPQTLKADDVTITATTDSRGYYLGSDNSYYAKVTAAPYSSGYTFSDGSTVTSGTVYYFKVEPILWRILSQSDDTALILCDSIIANKAYQSSYQYSNGEYYTTANDAPNGTYANNYQYSEVRAWLNAEFYNTAFTALEQELILTTTVDNSIASTGYSSNPYACENTNDKVFLLSYAEVTNSAYGFASSYSTYDTARRMQTSDYSRATGAYTSTSTDYYGNGYWWLRSPSNDYSSYARFVYYGGDVFISSVIITYYGVVPALQIRLN